MMYFWNEEKWRTYCDSALGTLAESQSEAAVNKELRELCGYPNLDAVPEEGRQEVEITVERELQARRCIGSEAYQKCKTYGEKIDLYIAALEMMRENKDKLAERVTFSEFRNLQQKAVACAPGIELEVEQTVLTDARR